MSRTERPGWSFMPAEDRLEGDMVDTVEGFLEGANFGVRGQGTTWRICRIDENEVLTVEHIVYASVDDAMDEVERRE